MSAEAYELPYFFSNLILQNLILCRILHLQFLLNLSPAMWSVSFQITKLHKIRGVQIFPHLLQLGLQNLASFIMKIMSKTVVCIILCIYNFILPNDL